MKINSIAQQTLQIMIESSLIPKEDTFEITEELIFEHRKIYSSFGDGYHHGIRNARRMSGKSLLWLKKQRTKDIKEGFVYLITNPAWPNHTKVGVTTDLSSRLSTYQTSDPFRSFTISNFEFVLNKRMIEKLVLDECKVDLSHGEWIRNNDTTKLIQLVRKHIAPIVIDYNAIYTNGEPIIIGDIVKIKPKNKQLLYGKVNRFTSKRVEVDIHRSKFIHLKPEQLQLVKRV